MDRTLYYGKHLPNDFIGGPEYIAYATTCEPIQAGEWGIVETEDGQMTAQARIPAGTMLRESHNVVVVADKTRTVIFAWDHDPEWV